MIRGDGDIDSLFGRGWAGDCSGNFDERDGEWAKGNEEGGRLGGGDDRLQKRKRI